MADPKPSSGVKPSVIEGGGGPKWFEVSSDGKPKASYRNAQVALECLGAVFSFDDFRQRSLVNWHMFGKDSVEVSDTHAVLLRKAITDRYEFDPRKDHVGDAIAALCLLNRFDPVRAYLDGLKWDGRRRIDQWLTYYLGVEDTPLAREFGRKTLLAAVRRVRQPGCKFDYILTLEGVQGAGKSSALRCLATFPDVFTDQDILHLDAKGQQEALAGKWIVELAELTGLRRTEVERVKAFASRQHDRARAAYARFSIDQPRRCVMIGTTNAEEYLTDPTGNRRFWPVLTTSIDLEALAADRDQLWAESAAAEATGEPLELAPELWDAAAAQQFAREERDPWEDILRVMDVATDSDGCQRVFSRELMGDEDKLKIPRDRQNTAAAQRLARVMRRLGWDGPKLLSKSPDVEDDTRRARGYERKNPKSTVREQRNEQRDFR